MESDLTSPDPYTRAKAVGNLANVMLLDSLEKANSYLDFFLARLSDQLSVGGALDGILRILRESKINNLEKVPDAILQELNFSSLPQSDRFKILRIYSYCISTISRDFVQGFLHLVQGEKDPRCLLLAFTLMKDMMESFDCSGLEEDIFDWTFAYFPITFKDKSNDPHAVSHEDLKNGLKNCMSAHLIGMGKFVVPFLMEKMESSLGLTKRDTMIFLGHASKIYQHDLLVQILPKLWVWLKEEVMRPDNQENAAIALTTMQDVLRSVSLVHVFSNDGRSNSWEKWVELIMIDIFNSLESSDHNTVMFTEKIFLKLASTSKLVYDMIVSKYAKKLLDMFVSETSTPRKVVLNIFLFRLLEAGRIVNTSVKPTDEILILKDSLLEIFTLIISSSTNYSQLRYYSLAGLSEIMRTNGILNIEEINNLIMHMKIIMLEESESENQKLARETLRDIGMSFPESVHTYCGQALFEMILNGHNADQDSALYIAFVTVFMEDSLFSKALSFLTKLIIDGKLRLSLKEIAFNRKDPRTSINLLDLSFELINKRTEFQSSRGLPNKINVSSNLLLRPIMTYGIENVDILGMKEMIVFERIAIKIMRNLCEIEQLEIAKLYFSNTSPTVFQSYFLVPLVALIGNSRPEIGNHIDFTPALTSLLQSSTFSATIKNYSYKLIASIVNKFNIDNDQIKHILELIKTKIEDSSLSLDCRYENGKLYAWVTKALLLRPRIGIVEMDMVLYILSLHNNCDLSRVASEFVEIIISDDILGYLSRDSFCHTNRLFKQKVFNHCLPVICDGLKNAKKGTCEVYLVSMSHMLRNIHTSVLLTQATKLFPFIIQSMEAADSKLALVALDLLFDLIQDSPQLVSQHMSSILPILLQKVVFDNGLNPLPVRISACRSLSMLPKFIEYSVLHPFKAKTSTELGRACDDHKRIVRNMAAKARNQWLVL